MATDAVNAYLNLLTPGQRKFLDARAAAESDNEALRLSDIKKSSLDVWKKSNADFMVVYRLVTQDPREVFKMALAYRLVGIANAAVDRISDYFNMDWKEIDVERADVLKDIADRSIRFLKEIKVAQVLPSRETLEKAPEMETADEVRALVMGNG